MRETLTGLTAGAIAVTYGFIAQAVPAGANDIMAMLKEGGALLATVIAIIYLLQEKKSMKADHRAELDKKDAQITRLEEKVDEQEDRINELQSKVTSLTELLGRTIKQVDVTTTLKRSALEFENE